MIDFEKKLTRISGSARLFAKEFHISNYVIDRLCEDYKYFLEIPTITARSIANGLGDKFSWVVYNVESEIVKDMYEDICKKWDNVFQEQMEHYNRVDDYLPFIFSKCMDYKKYLKNKDIMRSLAITVHIDAKQRKENPHPDLENQYYFSGILKHDKEIKKEFTNIKGNPNRLMKWMEIISREAEYNLNTKDLAKSIFYFFNTIV